MNCEGIIDLRHPVGQERRRGFQPPWYTVFKYVCPACGQVRYVRACAFRGSRPEPGIGGIICGSSTPVSPIPWRV